MSSEQLLLTIGIALLVFDTKKIPRLIRNLATVLVFCRKHYQDMMVKVEQVLQGAMHQSQLEQNIQKARFVEEQQHSIPTIDEE